jgi:hypothetical protein
MDTRPCKHCSHFDATITARGHVSDSWPNLLLIVPSLVNLYVLPRSLFPGSRPVFLPTARLLAQAQETSVSVWRERARKRSGSCG